jgi:hypothetical protein
LTDRGKSFWKKINQGYCGGSSGRALMIKKNQGIKVEQKLFFTSQLNHGTDGFQV